MTFNVPFEYGNHFLQIVVRFLSCPVGILFIGLIVVLLIVNIFNSLRR